MQSWQHVAAQYAPIFVLVLYVVLAAALRLAAQRSWRWTAWLRQGRRRVDIAAMLVAVAGLLPDVFDGTLRAGAVATVFSTWYLARMLPADNVALRAPEVEPPAPLPTARTMRGAPEVRS